MSTTHVVLLRSKYCVTGNESKRTKGGPQNSKFDISNQFNIGHLINHH